MKNEYLCIIITQVIPMGYIDDILEISSRIHTGLVDFDEPRSESPRPTQASSVFITNKQQGDWAEDVLFHAINDNSSKLVAVRYGRSEDLVAGDEDFEAFYDNYQKELDEIGKRPDSSYSGMKTMTLCWEPISAVATEQRLKNMSKRLLPVLK